MRPEDFPRLQLLARNGASFDEAVRLLAGGLLAGSIRNQTLIQVKTTLGRVIESGWTKTVSEPFFCGGKFERQPKAVNDLYHSMMVTGLHNLIAMSKKLAKTKAEGAAVEAMRALVNEALPLAEAVRSLKAHVIKGRESNQNTKPVNPNKVIKTCACCFRAIAVANATMAHHGYQRPGTGWQTASCPGIRFAPLEISSEGLEWLIGSLKSERDRIEKAIEGSPLLQSLSVREVGDRFATITQESPRWAREYQHYVEGLESQLRMINATLPEIDTMLRNWTPETGSATEQRVVDDTPSRGM